MEMVDRANLIDFFFSSEKGADLIKELWLQDAFEERRRRYSNNSFEIDNDL